MKKDKELFELVERETRHKWKKFSKYYVNDSKPFINKISRDYESSGNFPVHILKQIKKIPKNNYDSAICVLRGALPYSVLFEAMGWKVHYVICGRRNEEHKNLRFSRSVDKTIKKIKGKRVLIIENNSPTGNTPTKAVAKLKRQLGIKKPDLFLDYFSYPHKKLMSWMKSPFWKNKTLLGKFGKIYEAASINVSKAEGKELIKEFLGK